MKQKDIKIGDKIFLKSRFINEGDKSMDDSIIISKIEKRIKGGHRYYSDKHKGYFRAFDLTDISCSEKECPCH